MIKMYKPSGQEVLVNERSLEYAKSLGWSEKKPTSRKKKASDGNSK